MKKTKKTLSVIALLLCILFLLTACGGGSGGAPASSGGSGSGGSAGSGEKSNEKIADLTEYAKSLGTPLSAEDAAIWAKVEETSQNSDKVVWRHGAVNRSLEELPTLRGDRQFMIEMKKRLGDKVEFQIFFGGTLGTSADQILGGLQNRNFESYAYNVGAFAEYTKAFMPLDVMFLIPDLEAGIAVCAGEPGEIMRQKCIEDTGLNVLTMGAIGMRHITNSKKPLATVADMKGLKIRTQNNPLHIMAFQALGCSPTPIAYAELFTSLQQKVVDGQENPISNMFEQNFREVQGYLTLSNHLYTAAAFVVNDEWLKEQTPEFQKAVAESAAIAQAYSGPDLISSEAAMLEYMGQTMEITSLEGPAFEEFKKISMSTWDQAAERIGKDYFEKVKASIEKTIQ